MRFLKPSYNRFHRPPARPISAASSTVSPPVNTHLVGRTIAILKRHHPSLLESLASQFTPQLASYLLLQTQFDQNLTLKFLDWARNRHFFDLQCKCFVIHILTRFKRYKSAQSLVEDVALNYQEDDEDKLVFSCLKDSYHSCNSSSAVFDLVVKSYSHLNMVDRALNMITLAKFHGFMPSILSYNSVLDSIIRVSSCGYIDLAKKVYRDMLSSGISPNVYSYNILIRGLCGNKELEKGLSLFDEMGRNGCLPNLVTCNTLIDSHCKLGRVDEALSFMKSLGERNLEPNVITYNAILNGLCREGRMGETTEIFEEMRNKGLVPDEVTYNTLVNGYCRYGDFHRALVLHSQMLRNGLRPNVVTYTSLICSMCKEGNMHRAVEFFNQMKIRGVRPNERTYTTLVDGFCQQGLMTEAYQVLEEMISTGFLPSIVTYNALINGHCLCGAVEDALRMMQDMVLKGISPDVVTYSTIISAFCRKQDVNKAFQIKQQMVEKGILPDAITYTALIQGLCDQRRLKEGYQLFQEMWSKGLPPDKCTYTSLINGYCAEGDIKSALCLHKEMISKNFFPDVVTYNVLINGLNKQAHNEEAKKLTFGIFNEQSVPNNVTYDLLIESCGNIGPKSPVALVKAFCMKGLMNEADRVFDSMLQMNQKPEEGVYNILIHGHSRNGNLNKAVNLYREMLRSRFTPHTLTVIALLKELYRQGMNDQMNEVIHNTLSSCRLTDAELAKVLEEVNYKGGNFEAVFDALTVVAKDGLPPKSGRTAYALL